MKTKIFSLLIITILLSSCWSKNLAEEMNNMDEKTKQSIVDELNEKWVVPNELKTQTWEIKEELTEKETLENMIEESEEENSTEEKEEERTNTWDISTEELINDLSEDFDEEIDREILNLLK